MCKVEYKSVKIRSSVTLVAFMFICLRRLERYILLLHFYRYLNMASNLTKNIVLRVLSNSYSDNTNSIGVINSLSKINQDN